MAKQRWVITISGSRSLNDIRKNVVETGFTVDQVLGEMSLITGVAEDEVADKVREIPGVVDVSLELGADVGHPDAPIS